MIGNLKNRQSSLSYSCSVPIWKRTPNKTRSVIKELTEMARKPLKLMEDGEFEEVDVDERVDVGDVLLVKTG